MAETTSAVASDLALVLPEVTSDYFNKTVDDLADIADGTGYAKMTAAESLRAKAQKSLNSGLICAPLASVPEWPDAVAGTTYFQNAWADDDSWAKGNITSTFLVAGIAKLTCTGTLPTYTRTISIPTATAKTAKIKLRKLAGPVGDIEISLRDATSATTYANAAYTGVSDWQILNFDVASDADWTGTLSALRILFRYADATSVWEIDWIYIGDGTYSSLALDGSGSRNHATVVGATPVDTVAGRGFSFDGVSDYLEKTSFSLVYPFSMGSWITPRSAVAGQAISNYKNGASDNYISIGYDGAKVTALIRSTASSQTITGPDLAVGATARVDLVCASDTDKKLYINGLLYASNSVSVTPSVDVLFFGRLRVLTSGSFLNGTIADPRIYNRALTAEEVWELYSKPGMARMSGPVIASVSGAPHSLVARDANGYHNTLKMASGAGIDFSANASAAGMTSEVLSDYEEGTWDLGVSFGGASVGVTYTVQAGSYTKIGNRVFISGQVVLSAKGSSVGTALITGLPFVANNSARNYSALGIKLAGVTFADTPFGFPLLNTTTIYLGETTNAGVVTVLSDTDFSATANIIISGHYYV